MISFKTRLRKVGTSYYLEIPQPLARNMSKEEVFKATIEFEEEWCENAQAD